MVDTNKIWQALFIMLFAGAIVVLGAKDIERHLQKTSKRGERTKNLLQKLHGDQTPDQIDQVRASPRRSWIPDLSLGGSWADNFRNIGQDRDRPTKRSGTLQSNNVNNKGAMGKEDSTELKKLLEEID